MKGGRIFYPHLAITVIATATIADGVNFTTVLQCCPDAAHVAVGGALAFALVLSQLPSSSTARPAGK